MVRFRGSGVQGPPEPFGGQREVQVGLAERGERVGGGVQQRGGHADAAGLADALGAERVRGWVGVAATCSISGNVVRPRHRVVHQRAGQQLAASS
jgi:hypothetical protein